MFLSSKGNEEVSLALNFPGAPAVCVKSYQVQNARPSLAKAPGWSTLHDDA